MQLYTSITALHSKLRDSLIIKASKTCALSTEEYNLKAPSSYDLPNAKILSQTRSIGTISFVCKIVVSMQTVGINLNMSTNSINFIMQRKKFKFTWCHVSNGTLKCR